MENKFDGNKEAPKEPVVVNLWDLKPRDGVIIAPAGKGRSFYAEMLRRENPDKTIVEIELEQDTKELMNREPESYSKMSKELSPELLGKACEVVQVCTGVILTQEQILQLIDTDPTLCFSLVLNGANDTEVRGDLASALSSKLLGKRWGTYGDKDFDVNQFVKELHAAAAQHGYLVEVPEND